MSDQRLQQGRRELERQRDQSDLRKIERIVVLQDRIHRCDQGLHGVVEELREADADEHDIGWPGRGCFQRRGLDDDRLGQGFIGDDNRLVQGIIPGKAASNVFPTPRVSLRPPLLENGCDACAAPGQAAAWPSAETIWSTTSSTSRRSSPSPITRITGSVPDERTSRRPWPLSRFSPATIADLTSALSSGLPERERTVLS